MKNIGIIANMPTDLRREDLDKNASGYHESLLRSYHIVAKLRWLIEKRVDHEVILEILALLESDDFQPYGWFEQRAKRQFEHIQDSPLVQTMQPNE